MIPVRMPNEQLVLLEPGLTDAQVRELFDTLLLKGNRDGFFAEEPKESDRA